MIFEPSNPHLGSFDFHGTNVFGELHLDAARSLLKLRTEDKPVHCSAPRELYGKFHDFNFVSCLDCVGGAEPNERFDSRGNSSYSWNLFPHFVVIGNRLFDPKNDKISSIYFSITDVSKIFDDFDSYGVVYDCPAQVLDMIPKSIGDRQVPHGPKPKLAYFAGRTDLLKVEVTDGCINVQHWPSFDMGSSEGIRLGSRLMLSIDFSEPEELTSCIGSVTRLLRFFSLVAGRTQSVSDIQIKVDGANERDLPLSLYWSLAPSVEHSEAETDEPSFRDMPLDAIRRPDEFANSLSSWWQESSAQKVARSRFHSCRERGNHFDVDRLIAAANMFDLRVSNGTAAIAPELARVCKESVTALKELPNTDDRNEAIRALKRVGQLSLRKKILIRADVVKSRFILADLDEVVQIAVQCRNHFVHGGGGRSFDYSVIEPYTVFLTETLEFIFGVAELIDCGWDGAAWKSRSHTARHWFCRYLSGYSEHATQLLLTSKKK
ncbi:hypothetical protein GSY71_06405 [Pusillimonas sp. TS35]|nr:hypothetical protein [Pusillimonas sp. TS35]